ncbi:MAG TPA: hypothetical protein DDW87_13655 [Firmicutes bacterium]|nr:hypothetical protein [Bacillota bacterium]
MRRTTRHILIGAALAVLGWLLIFAMVLELIPRPIELYIAAYAVSFAGFVLGMASVFNEIRENLRRNRRDNE